MYQKYVNALPLYRQEKDWLTLGMKLCWSMLDNWIIRSSEDWLMPVQDFLKEAL